MLEKIAKVLAQAENASTPEEAETYFAAAQALSTKYSIDLAVARQHVAKGEKPQPPERRTVNIDTGKNLKKHLVNLFSTISGFNDVKIDISHDSTRVYPYGFPSDLDVVVAIFASVSAQMVRSANEYIDKGEFKSETQGRWVRYKTDYGYWDEKWVVKPVDGRVARSSFYSAYILSLSHKFRSAKTKAIEEVTSEQTEEVSQSTSLAIIDKTKRVQDFYSKSSKAKGSWKGNSSSGYSTSASTAGRIAGSSASIGGQGSINGNRKAIHA